MAGRKTERSQRKARPGSSHGLALRSGLTQFNCSVSSGCQRGVNMDRNDSLADKFGAIRGLKMSLYVTKRTIAL